jgi:iron complex transport system substrate-binding protein
VVQAGLASLISLISLMVPSVTPLLMMGCDRDAGSADAAVAPAPSGRIQRIVSLSPAMSTMLVDLGGDELVVGRTPWCRGIDGATVVGTLEGPDAELLLAAKPDLVLVQPPTSGIDPAVLELQRRMGFQVIAHRLDGVEDITGVVRALSDRGVITESVEEAWLDRTEFIREAVGPDGASAEDASVVELVMLHSVDPFGLVGRDTYLDEVIRAAGGRNLVRRSGWIEAGVEELVSLEPPVVVLVMAKSDDGRKLATLRSLPWRKTPRFEVLLSADAFEPSTRIPDVVADLRSVLDSSATTSAREGAP